MENKISFTSNEKLNKIYQALLESISQFALEIRNSSGGGKLLDTENKFGDVQLELDIACEKIMLEKLKKTGCVSHALSEENPHPQDLGGKDFIVCFDPLDGSSIIGLNWTVGSIFGVWPSDEKILIGKKGKDAVGAGIAVYGPRTTVLLLCDEEVNEYTFKHDKEWVLSAKNIKIQNRTKTFAPGNLRAVNDYPAYKKIFDYWVNHKYTLRYTGGMVPDVYQIFVRGDGIFSNLAGPTNTPKLRLLYEILPIAKLFEAAGGKATDGKVSLSELIIDNYEQKSEICVGSQEEVERIEKFLKE